MGAKKKNDRPGEGTKFTLDRKIFSSDIWFDSAWTLKIWIYLLGHANYKDTYENGVLVKRGQLIRSYRTIAKDCGYRIGYRLKKPSTSTVHNVCEKLSKLGRISQRQIYEEITKRARSERRSEHLGTLITVLNYNELQPFQKHEPNDEPNTYRTLTEHSKEGSKKEKTLSGMKPDPDVKVFILEWERIWTEKFGKPYTVNWGKDGKIVKEILNVHSLPELRELRQGFFESQDPFINGSDYSIGVFKTQLNKLVVTRKTDPVEEARREMRGAREG